MDPPHASAAKSGPRVVYAVKMWDKVELFDDATTAHSYAAQDPSAVIVTHPLRLATTETCRVYDRRVVVREGNVVLELNAEVVDYYDCTQEPPAADVEVYEKDPDEWHVVGLGTNSELLATRMSQAVARVRRLCRSG